MNESFPQSWIDHEGHLHNTPAGKQLHMSKYPSHAALRAFVYRRDKFTCQSCGAKPLITPEPPESFSGFNTLSADRKNSNGWNVVLVIDHIRSRNNGGSNHPSNLQTLCDSCNSQKAALVDSKGHN